MPIGLEGRLSAIDTEKSEKCEARPDLSILEFQSKSSTVILSPELMINEPVIFEGSVLVCVDERFPNG